MTKILLLSFLLLSTSLSAKVQDKWKINAGAMFVTNFETEMRLTPNGAPVGVRINTKDQLGMENDTGVFRLDGYYRLTDIHSIDFSFFSIRSNGGRVINQDIEWDEGDISAGAKITSHFNMNVYKVNYGYSFYHNEKVELTLTTGLHITTLDVGLGATGTVNNTPTNAYSSSASATIPLPVVGFKGEYTIIKDSLFVNYKADYFVLNYDGFTGSLISTALNVEYRFVEHVGVGLGFNSNKIYLEAKDDDKTLDIINELSGVLLYFTYVY